VSSRRVSGRLLLAVPVGAVVVLGLVGYAGYRAHGLVERVDAVDELAHHIEARTLESHLWLEGRLSANADPELEARAVGQLDEARETCRTLATTGQSPLRAPESRALTEQLCEQLDRLEALTEQRLADPAAHGPGSEMDGVYDAAFDETLARIGDVHDAARQEVQTDLAWLTTLAAALVGLLAAVFAALGVFVRRQGKRLEELTARHATILGTASDGIVGLDRYGRLTFANAAAQQLIGCHGGELVGRRLRDLLHPDEQTSPAHDWGDCPLAESLRQATPLRAADERLLCHDGSTLTAECSLAPITVDGEATGAVLMLRDVTERRAVEGERNQLASVLAETPDATIIGLPEGGVHWMNPAGRALLGLGADEDVTGYHIEDLFPEEEMGRVYRDVMPVVIRDGAWAGELVLQAGDGAQIPVWATLRAHHDEHGERRYVSALTRDLRPRLEEERKVRHSERRLAEAQRLAHVGSIEVDVATGAAHVSDEMARIHGLPEDTAEISTETMLEHVHPDDRAELRARVDDVATSEEEAVFEYRARWPDGTERVVQGRARGELDEHSRPLKVLGTAQDVTELREVERLKDQFVSMISHELRTPLTSIHGSLRLLQGVGLDADRERAQRMIDMAESNTDRLIRLVNDILDVERLASGRITMQPQRCDLAELARRAVELMQHTADEAGVDLESEMTPLSLEADPDRLDQVLTNLLSNAIKFSPEGGVVRLTAEAGDGVAVVRVADQGRGVPPDQLEAILERFRQVEAADSRRKGGTGLGLPSAAASSSSTAGGSGPRASRSATPRSRSRCRCRPGGTSPTSPAPRCWSATTKPPTTGSPPCWPSAATRCSPPPVELRRWSWRRATSPISSCSIC
jgi:PAS domain S-box-containing protein